jgi:hypothetical protein
MDMTERSVFISSCSRRQLARRRPSPNAYQLQLLVAMIILFAAAVAFLGVRIGL